MESNETFVDGKEEQVREARVEGSQTRVASVCKNVSNSETIR